MLKPNLEYIVSKYKTAYEKYQIEEKERQKLMSNGHADAPKQKSKELIHFKFADYDNKSSNISE